MSSCPRCNAVLPSEEGPCPACDETEAGSDREAFLESPTVSHRGVFLGVETDLDPRNDLTPLESWENLPSTESNEGPPTVEAGQDIAASPGESREDLTPVVAMDDSNPPMASLLEQAARAVDEVGDKEPEGDEPVAVGEAAEGNITERQTPSGKLQRGFKEAPTRGWDSRFDPNAVAMAAPGGGDGKSSASPPLVTTALHTPRFTPPPIHTEQLREDPTTPSGQTREERREDPTTPSGQTREEPREDPTAPSGQTAEEPREDPTAPSGQTAEEPRENPTAPSAPAGDHEEEGERLEDLVAAHQPATTSDQGLLDREDGTTIPKMALDFQATSTPANSPIPETDPGLRRLINIFVGFLVSVLVFGAVVWLLFK